MRLQRTGVRELKAADSTDVRFISRVYSQVYTKVARRLESLVADTTTPRNLISVQCQNMSAQRPFRLETLQADLALIGSFGRVNARMPLKVTRATERHRATGALMRPVSGVDAHVQMNADRVLEAATADGTHVRHVVGMRALVERASAVLREALVTSGDTTRNATFTGVRHDVRVERRHRLEHASAVIAHERHRCLFSRHGDLSLGCRHTMRCCMCLQCRHILERHPTYGAVH